MTIVKIYEIGADGCWTGAKQTIGLMDGAPPGWTRTTPPELAAGEYAYWTGAWQIIKAVPQPAPVVPVSVPMRNAKLTLLYAGLLQKVDEYIAGMLGFDGDIARIDWATALTVRRDSPLVASLATALKKTEAEIDALFIDAAKRE